MTRPDEEADASGPDNIVVVASAGTGKTHRLVGEYLMSALGLYPGAKPISPTRLFAVTFTDKAAAEMKRRVADVMSGLLYHDDMPSELRTHPALADRPDLRAADIDKATVQWVLRHLPGAPVATFHALCLQLLKDMAWSAGLDPGFSLLDEAEYNDIVARAAEGAILDRLAADDPVVSELAARFQLRRYGGRGGLVGELCDLLGRLSETGIEPSDMALARDADAVRENRANATTRFHAAYAAATEALAPAKGPRDLEHRRVMQRSYTTIADALERTETDETGKLVGAFSALYTLERRRGFGRSGRAADACRDLMQTLRALGAALVDGATVEESAMMKTLADETRQRATASLDARGALGFGELLVRTRDVLRDIPTARARLKQRCERLLVDEYQDTSPVQADIVALLAERLDRHADVPAGTRAFDAVELGRGRLFIVGDPKQSIYAFRGTDARLFGHAHDVIVSGNAVSGATGEGQTLGVNYRSSPAVVSFCNVITEHAQGASAHTAPVQAHRDAAGPAGALLRPLERPDQARPDDVEAAIVARHIRGLLDGDDPELPDIDVGEFAILLPRIAPAAAFVRALSYVGVPAKVVGGKGFFTRPEVVDAITAMWLVAAPQSELAALALLRSPFIAAPDAALLSLAPPRRESYHWAHIAAAAQECDIAGDVADRIATMTQLLDQARLDLPDTSLRQVYDRLLDGSGYLSTVGTQRDSAERWANLEKLRALLDGDPLATLSRLWGYLDAPPREAPASVFETEEAAVRIMTVHKAKGLEFRVVYLTGMGAPLAPFPSAVAFLPETGLFVAPRGKAIAQLVDKDAPTAANAIALARREKDREERARLLYVAMTRARDRLYTVGEDHKRRASEEDSSLRGIFDLAYRKGRPATKNAFGVQRVVGDMPPARSLKVAEGDVPVDPPPPHRRGALRIAPSQLRIDGTLKVDGLVYQKRRGRLLHRLLRRAAEDFPDMPPAMRPAALTGLVRSLGEDPETEQMRTHMSRVAATIDGPLAALTAAARAVRFEVPLQWGRALPTGDVILAGAADVVIEYEDRALVVELKSSPKTAAHDETALQLTAYAGALAERDERPVYMLALAFGADADAAARARPLSDDDIDALDATLIRLTENVAEGRATVPVVDDGAER